MKSIEIEIYEWEADAGRPGVQEKPRDRIIDVLEVPAGGWIPQRGDVLAIAELPDPMSPTRYVVVEREILWSRLDKDDTSAARYSKAWLHVRRLNDPAEEGSTALK